MAVLDGDAEFDPAEITLSDKDRLRSSLAKASLSVRFLT